MNRVLFIIFCFPFTFCYAQDKPNTLLWEISKPQNPHKSYLFGTFHEVNPDFFDSLKIASSHLKKSELLILEAYSGGLDLNSQQNKSISPVYTWNKSMWDSILNKEQGAKFNNYVKSMYGSEDMYNSSPQLLAFTLARNYLQGICDTINRKSYDLMDTRIANIGLENKLQIIGLENDQTNEIKISSRTDSVLTNNSSINMIMDLMDYITNGNANTSISKILYDYKRFDIDYQFSESENPYTYLITGRNNNWMKNIPNFLEKNSCFIAVGYKHLTKKQGLIEQLRKLGYLITPIKP